MESGSSPLSNGLPDGLSSSKKACLDNGPANGSTMDSKLGLGDRNSNGTHRSAVEPVDVGVELDFHQKEMKQEPEDMLPIMPPSVAGNNSLFLDLNLNEQEWKELMEELNCSVDIQDIQDILNCGFEDRKDPLELAPAPVGGGAVGAGGGQSSQSLLPDLSSVKAEFSPSSAVFEQDSRTGSPHVRSTSSGPPPHLTSSPVASSSASSPVLPPSQPAPPPRQLQPPPNHLLPPGPPVSKDLSPAQQLQQLAAQQQRAQHIQGKMQHKQPQQGAKFHNQGPHNHAPPWTQMANSSQSSLGSTFGMDKPTSPALYPSDFNPNSQKQLLLPAQPNKGSPKAGAGSYMSGTAGPPNMLSHLSSVPPLSHPPAQGAQTPAAILNYKNTIPLSHFEAGPGPPRPPNCQIQDKAALLNLLRQQQKNSMNFRQHIAHSQDQNNFSAPPHVTGPANSMPSGPGNNPMTAPQGANAMAGNHSNAAFLNNQMAALKQQQQQHILEQQKKQQQYMQRQLLAEQEKQRQQDQQLQRHLTRPPPQYQDQTGPAANQNPFPQQSVGQFTTSSQPMSNIGSMGGPAPGSRMFPQNQSMMGMNMGQGGGPGGGVAPPTTVSQPDISMPSCGGGASVDTLYNNMNLHPNQQASLQRQPLGPMTTPYRQLQQQQQLLKQQPNAAMLKQQQQLAATRMPNTMQGSMGGRMGGSMQGGQGNTWQQQPSSNAGLHSNAFNNNAFHIQQPHIPKMAAGAASFGASSGGRPMTGLNAAQQMMQTNMAAQQRAPPAAQNLGQQQTQQQPAGQSQAVLPDLAAFGQPQGNGRQAMQCNQGYQVSRTASQQQQVSFGYNAAAGSFAAESDLVDSLLKGQSTQEWMADLDELLASHP
ncbi:mastermind-like protein 1 isoform X3 [Girardinichthys multiradiatus]|nr:mastermind-like protein 1 isoform X3 [Girardinichthys multiradiatus]